MQERFLPFTVTESVPLYTCAVGNMRIMHFKVHFGLRSPMSSAF